MAEKIEDLNLPSATVARIIKESLPEHVAVGKDARAAISRAASVFVMFLTSRASQEAQKETRKTLLGQDIITALEELEFDDFIEPLNAVHKDFKEEKLKKSTPRKKAAQNGTEDGDEEHDVRVEVKDEEISD